MLESYFNLQFTLISFSYVLNFSSYSKWTANSKYESWWKLWMEVYHCINMIIMVIQFPRVTFCFAWSYFNLQFTLISFSYVLNFSSYSKWTANSKYESWWKLWMEVYHCINMIIMVIQFPRVTFCFAWSYFNLPLHSYFQISSYLLYKLQIQSTKVGESY